MWRLRPIASFTVSLLSWAQVLLGKEGRSQIPIHTAASRQAETIAVVREEHRCRTRLVKYMGGFLRGWFS